MSEQHAKMIGVNAIVSDLSEVIKNEPVVRAQWIVTQTHLERALAFRSEDVSVGVASSPALKNGGIRKLDTFKRVQGQRRRAGCAEFKYRAS